MLLYSLIINFKPGLKTLDIVCCKHGKTILNAALFIDNKFQIWTKH